MQQSLSRLVVLVWPLALLACEPPTSNPTDGQGISATAVEELARNELDAARNGRQQRGIEDEILRLESDIPGLGGIFVDSLGQIVVYVPSGAVSADVRAQLASNARGMRVTEAIRARLISGDGVALRQGQWPFSRLLAWKRLLAPHLAGTAAFELDADEASNRVRIAVPAPDAVPQVHAAVLHAGVPPEAVYVVVAPPGDLANLSGRRRPTAGGLQIETNAGGTCTLGFNVTTDANAKGFITAAHCAGSVGLGGVGEIVYQPVYGINNRVGLVHTNPAWNQTSSYECPWTGRSCTYADAMYVEYDNGSDWALQVARTGSVSLVDSAGSRNVATSIWTEVKPPAPVILSGQAVDKVGRTSGWTRGTVGSTCVDFVPKKTQIVVLCSVRVDGGSGGGGDSGAPVFIPHATHADSLVPHGVLFGVTYGDTVSFDELGFIYCVENCSYWFSKLDAINNHLGINVYPAEYPYGGSSSLNYSSRTKVTP